MKLIFSTTIGDDIAVDVEGEWYPKDPSTGSSAQFQVDSIRLPYSLVDIQSLVNQKTMERIEEEGVMKGEEEFSL